MSSRKKDYCSFCGKNKDEVKELISSGNSACICNECVDHCNEIVNEKSPIIWRGELGEAPLKVILEDIEAQDFPKMSLTDFMEEVLKLFNEISRRVDNYREIEGKCKKLTGEIEEFDRHISETKSARDKVVSTLKEEEALAKKLQIAIKEKTCGALIFESLKPEINNE